MATEYIPVKYVRNAEDANGTEAVRFNDDSRNDITIGGFGLVTEDELSRLHAFGYVLERLEEDDEIAQAHEAAGIGEEVDEDNAPLHERYDIEGLRQLAKDEEVDISGLRSKKAIAGRIEEARLAEQEGEGRESLPATATRVGSAGVTVGGGAAGPGGAGSDPGTSGGGPAT